MSDVDAMVAWWRQQLDADEQLARAAAEQAPYDEWDAVGSRVDDEIGRSNWEVVRIARPPMTPAARAIAQHIARNDPKAVLAKIAAERSILAEFERDRDAAGSRPGPGTRMALAVWEAVIRALVQAYAGRDGWQKEWAA